MYIPSHPPHRETVSRLLDRTSFGPTRSLRSTAIVAVEEQALLSGAPVEPLPRCWRDINSAWINSMVESVKCKTDAADSPRAESDVSAEQLKKSNCVQERNKLLQKPGMTERVCFWRNGAQMVVCCWQLELITLPLCMSCVDQKVLRSVANVGEL